MAFFIFPQRSGPESRFLRRELLKTFELNKRRLTSAYRVDALYHFGVLDRAGVAGSARSRSFPLLSAKVIHLRRFVPIHNGPR